ncbi:MAG: hypothetical protein IPM54_25170 [Polyangiaceae bacterium]|nr:hypothetical protein [Polyangiaceae bacterium]
MKLLAIVIAMALPGCVATVEMPECIDAVDCDDGDVCTADRCSKFGQCIHTQYGGEECSQ